MGSVPVTVLVVDDDALVRDGLRRILESADDIRVPAVRGPGEALEPAHRHRPDVALVDLHMPGTDGIEVLRGLRKETPHVSVSILSRTSLRRTAVAVAGLTASPPRSSASTASSRTAGSRGMGRGVFCR
ncbi:response regulator transcription factor [Streptomyces sp. PTY087I2]|uniref:response regulator n=1 Tax=Streptomyces sp. PTY087I2 TaxID=1819298 RepID=UPI000827BC97|nr:response regulator transcription factor [Streptomyces sp. PTY087I2]OCC09311.1 Response regulator protein VraR [Streptomyces sp. PTY087I2]